MTQCRWHDFAHHSGGILSNNMMLISALGQLLISPISARSPLPVDRSTLVILHIFSPIYSRPLSEEDIQVQPSFLLLLHKYLFVQEKVRSDSFCLTFTTFGTKSSNAHCVLCAVYFSAQLNKLRPILEFEKYYPIEHIFVPACSSARKIHFFKF